ncbi:hypothetical protein K3U93_19570 [Mycobacterium malmoense]|uniref:hypothetical protein n=1 Tax=Mycobacterium malmoense TaxID=1780 RepID=UPI00111BD5C7|nr:hypothetical protein [Mycobacterium malmoense]QZA16812.1 hypothetical protein K3U93_19570 [Mycobacterium malmoense]UNB93606.1 hypothetical protein H5T25_19545 [Mycobacterium malmoense]
MGLGHEGARAITLLLTQSGIALNEQSKMMDLATIRRSTGMTQTELAANLGDGADRDQPAGRNQAG